MKFINNIIELIGDNPIIKLSRYTEKHRISGNVFAKLEYFNPAGSIKDRVALAMLENAEKNGQISQGGTIIEPTSGNTGIALAAIGKIKGYKVIIVMPDNMSCERRKLLSAYGAEVILTDGEKGMTGAICTARELLSHTPGAFMPSQFENTINPKTHRILTGPEIWSDMDGKIDIFVACVGTGGTLSGVGQYFKKMNKHIKVIAVEPMNSAVLSGESPGNHRIEGIGAGFIPQVLDTSVYDEIIKVKDEEAFQAMRDVALDEGLFVGISSGAVLAAITLLRESETISPSENIVTIFPDSGDKYLSLFEI